MIHHFYGSGSEGSKVGIRFRNSAGDHKIVSAPGSQTWQIQTCRSQRWLYKVYYWRAQSIRKNSIHIIKKKFIYAYNAMFAIYVTLFNLFLLLILRK